LNVAKRNVFLLRYVNSIQGGYDYLPLVFLDIWLLMIGTRSAQKTKGVNVSCMSE